jgi:hypothetical protein
MIHSHRTTTRLNLYEGHGLKWIQSWTDWWDYENGGMKHANPLAVMRWLAIGHSEDFVREGPPYAVYYDPTERIWQGLLQKFT